MTSSTTKDEPTTQFSGADLTVALAGNPNSGKTTVFNAITGARQHVGNYPGVTVEKKEGLRAVGDTTVHVVDLPGTYSLTAYSLEEVVARNFIIEERPDVVVHIVDGSNLERNLYLTTQLIELDVPVVVALNMMDVARSMGREIDADLLSELMGVPMVPTVATREEGTEELLRVAMKTAREGRGPTRHIHYGRELEEHVREISQVLEERGGIPPLPSRWVAIKLLEDDEEVASVVEGELPDGPELLERVTGVRAHLEAVIGDDAELALADARYGFINGACAHAVTSTGRTATDWSEAIDNVVTNRVVGIPILLVLMWGLFEMVFRVGAPPMDWLESFFGWLGAQAAVLLPGGVLESLIVDGIIGGVGGVLVFVPPIMLLFLGISLLEDSGYMSRAAFVVDKLMHHIGLHGKSFIPMLIGFGCTVPAIMATRTLESRRDRLTTMLVAPLMSCGARLVIYVLLAGAFFPPQTAGKVIFSIYLLGVVLAVVMAKLFRVTVLKGPLTPFVMELPPYRMPTLKGTLLHVWERAWCYIRKAGTIILAASVIMWALLTYPKAPPSADLGGLPPIAHTAAGRIGRTIEPVLRPLGFDWKIGISLVAGLAAKEVVVSTLATTYSIEEEAEASGAVAEALQRDPVVTPLVACAMMVFVLLYIPCVASMAVLWGESGSWKWVAFAVAYTTALAWLMSFLVYQGGLALGFT
ncbi:MAG: ferrous iron transport protein B [Armatimonadota bacterium]|nr:ferrous iron transport protein B [Armatimonadota bacterium]